MASSWLMGGLFEDGRDDQQVHADAQHDAERHAASAPSHTGQP